MGQRSVRVVVGQGDLEHAGSLRRVLERDDFDVVGDATNASQLARVLTDEQPDIVVLDDVIGVSAVELAAEIAPRARLVVVWPAAVMPIAGAVRVDPSEVATSLTATVALAAGLSGLGAVDRPEWIERVKKDPATLREMLAARGALPTRPSVTELQRRGHRLHPSPSAAKRAARAEDAAAAAVVPIGLAASRQDDPAEATPAEAAVPPAVLSSAWNRRLGIIALGGAAAAGALMIAIALGPNSGSQIVSAEPFPVTIQPAGGPPFTVGDGGTQNPGGTGGATTSGGGNGGVTTTTGGTTTEGTATGGTTGGSSSPHGSLGGLGGGAGAGSGSSGSGGSSGTGGSPGGPRSNSSHLPGAHGTGKPGTPGWRNPTPGGSGEHNPHGGPPGHGSDHQSHGSGHSGGGGTTGSTHGNGGGSAHGNAGGTRNGGGSGHGATRGNSPGHGRGAAHGNRAGHAQAGSHGNGHANGHAKTHGNAAAHRHKR
jgi:hypothetical protein